MVQNDPCADCVGRVCRSVCSMEHGAEEVNDHLNRGCQDEDEDEGGVENEHDAVGKVVCASAQICSKATDVDRCIKGGANFDLYPKDEANRWTIRKVGSGGSATYNFQVQDQSATTYLGIDGGVASGCSNNMFSSDRGQQDSKTLDFTITDDCHIKWNDVFITSKICTSEDSCKSDGGGSCALSDPRHDDKWTFYCTSSESAAEKDLDMSCFS